MVDSVSVESEARRALDALCAELKAAFGDGLLSVVLYGSAARGDHLGKGASDLNVVVVLQDLSLEALEPATAVNRAWEDKGNRPLLFFSPEWIKRSCDVFPLEFLDIVESHRVLWGPDPFAGLSVSGENLRLQCESELKTKLIHLRTGYVALREDEEALARLLAASHASVAAVCRGVLRLAGDAVPPHNREVLRRTAERCGLDAAAFEDVAMIKKGGPGAASVSVKLVFRRYYAQLEMLARAVDAGLTGGTSR